jgi:outer membrane protein OmpA-like peptidoglycan-associated protein
MSEYFPSEDVRALWYERRAVVLRALQAALAPLQSLGLEMRETQGWALWAKLGSWSVDVSTGMPFSTANTLLVLQRVMRVNGFGPGKPSFQETRVDFAPDSATLTDAGQAALAEAAEQLLRMLREGPAVKLNAQGRPAKRKPRSPTRNSLAARATYAKAVGQ